MFGLVHDDCLSRVKYTTNQITGYREEHDVVGCYARNADGNCPDFKPRGLIGWLKRLLGLNTQAAGETMQAAQQRTEIQWLDKSEARDGD